jgi:hypothetical protein
MVGETLEALHKSSQDGVVVGQAPIAEWWCRSPSCSLRRYHARVLEDELLFAVQKAMVVAVRLDVAVSTSDDLYHTQREGEMVW